MVWICEINERWLIIQDSALGNFIVANNTYGAITSTHGQQITLSLVNEESC